MSSSALDANIMKPVCLGLPLAKGTPVMIFCSGFPDTYNSFDLITPKFKTTHHIQLYIMPSYDSPGLPTSAYFGHSFRKITDDLASRLSTIKGIQGRGDLVLVGHDWGSIVVQRVASAYPSLATRVVLLDVGYLNPLKVGVKSLAVMASYQVWMALAFLVGRLTLGKLGDLMVAWYPWTTIGPAPYEFNEPRDRKEIRSWMAYPYFQLLFCTAFNGDAPNVKASNSYDLVSAVPTLFVYGARKRAMFHDANFLKRLANAKNGSKFEGLECGHWIQTQKPDELGRIMDSWLGGLK